MKKFNLELIFSKHGYDRFKKRNFTRDAIDCIFKYGCIYHAGKNTLAYWLNKKALSYLKMKEGAKKYLNMALLLSDDQTVITCMRCDKQPKHWKEAT